MSAPPETHLAEDGPPAPPRTSALAQFEVLYLGNVGAITGFFARRCSEPQVVADLTSETFVRAAAGFAGFDPRRGAARSWLYGIAGNVFAAHCQHDAGDRAVVEQLAGRRQLGDLEVEELAGRIDAERRARALLEGAHELSDLERAALEAVDMAGLTPIEAAEALGVTRVVLRKRLSRARSRLRKEQEDDG